MSDKRIAENVPHRTGPFQSRKFKSISRANSGPQANLTLDALILHHRHRFDGIYDGAHRAVRDARPTPNAPVSTYYHVTHTSQEPFIFIWPSR
jgi:hypothetical protein